MSQTETIPDDLCAARVAVAGVLEQLASVTEHLRGNPCPDQTQFFVLNWLIAVADSLLAPVRSDLNEACPKRPNDHDEALQGARAFAEAAAPYFRDGWDPNGFDEKVWLAHNRGFTESFRVGPEDYPRLDHEIAQATLRRAEKACDGKPTPETEQSNKPHPDGPEAGLWVWCGGAKHEVPQGNVYKLIEYFWNREWARYDALVGPVFDKLVEPQTIRSEVSATNAVLRELGIPWGLSADSRARVVRRGPLKPMRVRKGRAKKPKKYKSKPAR
jgi:hypothetical protein